MFGSYTLSVRDRAVFYAKYDANTGEGLWVDKIEGSGRTYSGGIAMADDN